MDNYFLNFGNSVSDEFGNHLRVNDDVCDNDVHDYRDIPDVNNGSGCKSDDDEDGVFEGDPDVRDVPTLTDADDGKDREENPVVFESLDVGDHGDGKDREENLVVFESLDVGDHDDGKDREENPVVFESLNGDHDDGNNGVENPVVFESLDVGDLDDDDGIDNPVAPEPLALRDGDEDDYDKNTKRPNLGDNDGDPMVAESQNLGEHGNVAVEAYVIRSGKCDDRDNEDGNDVTIMAHVRICENISSDVPDITDIDILGNAAADVPIASDIHNADDDDDDDDEGHADPAAQVAPDFRNPGGHHNDRLEVRNIRYPTFSEIRKLALAAFCILSLLMFSFHGAYFRGPGRYI